MKEKNNSWHIWFGWTGYWLPHYHYDVQSKNIPAPYWMKQFRWLFVGINWCLNHN